MLSNNKLKLTYRLILASTCHCYLTPAIQETGEDNMPPNVVVGSLPHLPHSMEDSLVCTSNNSYNTTSDHSSNNRELVRY